MDEDALLIEQFRRGKRAAFDKLVDKYRREIYFLLLRMVKNQEDAEELAQQAFINALGGIERFKGEAAFKTWLYRIAMNLANSRLRGAREMVELRDDMAHANSAEDSSPLDSLIRDESAREAVKALDTLGEKQRMVVTLRIFQELPYEEIAAIVGCSVDTAKVHLHYGLENLRKKLKSNEMQ